MCAVCAVVLSCNLRGNRNVCTLDCRPVKEHIVPEIRYCEELQCHLNNVAYMCMCVYAFVCGDMVTGAGIFSDCSVRVSISDDIVTINVQGISILLEV